MPDEMDKPPKSVSDYMARIGAKGGKQAGRWKTMTPEQRSEAARHAALARHAQNRRKLATQGSLLLAVPLKPEE